MKDIESTAGFFTICIGGESYRVRSFGKDLNTIRELESHLNHLMEGIKVQFPRASATRVMGILSIRLVDELFQIKKEQSFSNFSKLKSEIETLFHYTRSIV